MTGASLFLARQPLQVLLIVRLQVLFVERDGLTQSFNIQNNVFLELKREDMIMTMKMLRPELKIFVYSDFYRKPVIIGIGADLDRASVISEARSGVKEFLAARAAENPHGQATAVNCSTLNTMLSPDSSTSATMREPSATSPSSSRSASGFSSMRWIDRLSGRAP